MPFHGPTQGRGSSGRDHLLGHFSRKKDINGSFSHRGRHDKQGDHPDKRATRRGPTATAENTSEVSCKADLYTQACVLGGRWRRPQWKERSGDLDAMRGRDFSRLRRRGRPSAGITGRGNRRCRRHRRRSCRGRSVSWSATTKRVAEAGGTLRLRLISAALR